MKSKIGYRVRCRCNAVFIEVPKGKTHSEKYHSFFVAFFLQLQGQDRSKQFMICVIFGTVLARNWTATGAGSKLYRTNDPSGSANLVGAGPPDPASAAPTANPYFVKHLGLYRNLPSPTIKITVKNFIGGRAEMNNY